MNIDAYVGQARAALGRLDALVGTVNDVVENRVEKALKVGPLGVALVTLLLFD